MSYNNSPCPRGTVFYDDSRTVPAVAGDMNRLEGLPVCYEDISYVDKATKVSGREVKAILVKNVSGIALLPGTLVKWKTGYVGRQVDGYTKETGDKVAGIVDDWLPAAGAADDQVFNLIIGGPVRVRTNYLGDATTPIAVDDLIHSNTGSSTLVATDGAGKVATLSAAVTEAELGDERAVIGRALSAATTAQSDTLINAYVDINPAS